MTVSHPSSPRQTRPARRGTGLSFPAARQRRLCRIAGANLAPVRRDDHFAASVLHRVAPLDAVALAREPATALTRLGRAADDAEVGRGPTDLHVLQLAVLVDRRRVAFIRPDANP